jgi:FMN phosphatase YigB (HAD superfamily)
MLPEILLLDCGGTLSWPPFARVNDILRDLQGIEFPVEKAYEGFYRSGHALDSYLREHKQYPVDNNLELNHWVYEQGMELTGFKGVWTMDCTMELLRREGRMGNWDFTFPWVEESLVRLKAAGIPMGLVSNSDGRVAELLAGLDYAKYFETIVDSHIEQISKPDARLFYIALGAHGPRATSSARPSSPLPGPGRR